MLRDNLRRAFEIAASAGVALLFSALFVIAAVGPTPSIFEPAPIYA